MNLTKHFTLEEMTATNTELLNIPTKEQIANLKALCENVLEPLRVMYGKPIKVNSGFRSTLVNAKVKGAKNSDHLFGFAADIDAGSKEENKKLFELIKANFVYRQLIDEYNYSWVHVSFNPKDNKKQILHLK